MPNGKPGDHPYTDIVLHGANVYGAEIDELVRDIDRSGRDSLKRRIGELLWDHNPWWGKPVDHVFLLSELRRLREVAAN